MILMPESDGTFVCKKHKFKTDNLFEYLDHFGVEYDWMVRLNSHYSFNLFAFLRQLTEYIDDQNWAEVWSVTQSITLMMINASGEDFEEFVEETEVIQGTETMLEQLERFLGSHGNE